MKTNLQFRGHPRDGAVRRLNFPNCNSAARNSSPYFISLHFIPFHFVSFRVSSFPLFSLASPRRTKNAKKKSQIGERQHPRTSLSIWRAVCQTVNAMRCKRVSVSSRSGVSSFRLLFIVSWRVSPQRQQFARSQARDSELLFEFVMVPSNVRSFIYIWDNFTLSSIDDLNSGSI